MGGILRTLFGVLSRVRLFNSRASKEIGETEASEALKIPETAPVTIPRDSEKKERLVSRNIDVPKRTKKDCDNNYEAKIQNPRLLYYMDHRAMKSKNKSRRRAYEPADLGTLDWYSSTNACAKKRNSDSPDLIFPMD